MNIICDNIYTSSELRKGGRYLYLFLFISGAVAAGFFLLQLTAISNRVVGPIQIKVF